MRKPLSAKLEIMRLEDRALPNSLSSPLSDAVTSGLISMQQLLADGLSGTTNEKKHVRAQSVNTESHHRPGEAARLGRTPKAQATRHAAGKHHNHPNHRRAEMPLRRPQVSNQHRPVGPIVKADGWTSYLVESYDQNTYSVPTTNPPVPFLSAYNDPAYYFSNGNQPSVRSRQSE